MGHGTLPKEGHTECQEFSQGKRRRVGKLRNERRILDNRRERKGAVVVWRLREEKHKAEVPKKKKHEEKEVKVMQE